MIEVATSFKTELEGVTYKGMPVTMAYDEKRSCCQIYSFEPTGELVMFCKVYPNYEQSEAYRKHQVSLAVRALATFKGVEAPIEKRPANKLKRINVLVSEDPPKRQFVISKTGQRHGLKKRVAPLRVYRLRPAKPPTDPLPDIVYTKWPVKHQLRRLIVRDGLECCWCGIVCDPTARPTADDAPTREHIIRRADGGSNSLSNQRVACRKCNNSRHHA